MIFICFDLKSCCAKLRRTIKRGWMLFLALLMLAGTLAAQDERSRAPGHCWWMIGAYIDRTGKVVIPPVFHAAGDFLRGFAHVTTCDGREGYIDRTGRFVDKPVTTISSENWHEAELTAAEKDGKWGFVNRTGRFVIAPRFESVHEFREALAAVSVKGKWGFVGTTGRLVIPIRFDYVDDFSEGFAAASLHPELYGLIDKRGRFVTPPQFSSVGSLSEGLAKACYLTEGYQTARLTCGFIDKTGRFIIKPRFSDATWFKDGLATVEFPSKILGIDGRWGIIDKTGKTVVKPRYREILTFSEGLAAARSGSTWSYIDQTGKTIIGPLSIHAASRFSDGLAHISVSDDRLPAESSLSSAQAYVDRGKIREKKADLDGAMSDYTQAISMNAQLAEAYYLRAHVRHVKLDPKGAIADLTQVIILVPRIAQAYSGRGALLEDKGDLEAALTDYTQAISINSQYARAYYGRGRIRYRKNDWEGAISDLAQAIISSPQIAEPELVESLGQAYLKIGDADKAQHYLCEKPVCSSVPLIQEDLGDLYHKQGKSKEAQLAWKAALADSTDEQQKSRLKSKLIERGTGR